MLAKLKTVTIDGTEYTLRRLNCAVCDEVEKASEAGTSPRMIAALIVAGGVVGVGMSAAEIYSTADSSLVDQLHLAIIAHTSEREEFVPKHGAELLKAWLEAH